MALTLLIQFVFRLSFGMALAMALTPSRLVSSGFYRVHLWVLMGLNTLAILALMAKPGHLATEESSTAWTIALVTAIVAAAASYFGAVFWLYEKSTIGTVALAVVSLATLLGATAATPWPADGGVGMYVLGFSDLFTGGLLLGVTIAAMFLGHWYLNTPTMQLVPLQRLVLMMGIAVLARTALCAIGLTLQWQHDPPTFTLLLFISLRWLSGLIGALVLAIMTWETLKIPNTQSATGILYVGVICTFLGELTSQLLSVEGLYPL